MLAPLALAAARRPCLAAAQAQEAGQDRRRHGRRGSRGQRGTPDAGRSPAGRGRAAEVDLSGIAKADGGKTVAEVLRREGPRSPDQPVIVRGKVVKTNAGIMGKNWLHVRDGSGAEGTNDLTVTTDWRTLPDARRHRRRHRTGHAEQGLRHGLHRTT
ncbi:MAG: hypothetical protein MZV65_31320 [Chromatiales bacterium]|nr:hypothetical protein [Chromatiales bacterium]